MRIEQLHVEHDIHFLKPLSAEGALSVGSPTPPGGLRSGALQGISASGSPSARAVLTEHNIYYNLISYITVFDYRIFPDFNFP